MTRRAKTGIDWSYWLASDRVLDPYLIWADVTRFAMCGDADVTQTLPFVMEAAVDLQLSPGGLPPPLQRVRVPPAYLDAKECPSSRFFTAQVRLRDLDALLRSHELVSRFQLSVARPGRQPSSHMDEEDFPPKPLAPSHRQPAGLMDFATVVGVIDDGCPFAHSNLSDRSGRTRVRYLWDQGASVSEESASPTWERPNGFPNGLETRGATLDRYKARFAQGNVYAALGMDRITGRRRTHGNAVCHLGAGGHVPVDMTDRTAAAIPDSQLPVVFVQLPLRTVADTTGGSIGYHVLDALHYIVARANDLAVSTGAPASCRTVINLSYGSVAGPHDGTSLVESAIADFLVRHDKTSLVVAAGNSNLDALHVELFVPAQGTRVVDWMVGPDNPLESYLEIWWPQGVDLDDMEVGLACDGKEDSVIATIGSMATDDAADPRCAVVFCRKVAQGLHGTMTLLAIRATRGERRAQPGRWKVSIHNRGQKGVRGVHLWVERNDLVLGQHRRQQSLLAKTPPRRDARQTMTLASMSNIDVNQWFGTRKTARYLVVGASRLSDGARADYSSTGPTRQAEREGTDGLAPADVGSAQTGLLVHGPLDGQWTRAAGSSAAAAVATRQLAGDFERSARPSKAPGSGSKLRVRELSKGDEDGWFRLELEGRKEVTP